jgi:microcystin-dependent protein
MIEFNKTTGGLPLTPTILDDLLQGQKDALVAIVTALAIDPADKTALYGCRVIPSVGSLNVQPGWVFWSGELYEVQPAAVDLITTDAGVCSLVVVEESTPDWTVALEDGGVHAVVTRKYLQLELTNNVPVGATAFGLTGLTYLDIAGACPGDWKWWSVPANRNLQDYFDNSGMGLGLQRGWLIAAGQTVDGTVMPTPMGRTFVAAGQLAGGGLYISGQKIGAETVTLDIDQIPEHNHLPTGDANSKLLAQWAPVGGAAVTATSYDAAASPNDELNLKDGGELEARGGGDPHANIQPSFVAYALYRWK